MEISLYPFQAASVEALRANFRQRVTAQILSAPTGSGKTIVGTYLLKECFAKGKKAVFVVDRLSLVDQTSAVLDYYQIPHGVIQANHWRWQPYQKIQVASAMTLARRGWPEDLDLILVDEAHTLHKIITSRIKRRDVRTVGLTATPFAKGMGAVYQSVVSVTTTNALIESGVLSPFRVFAASEPDMSGAKVVAGEWTDAEAERRAMPIVGDCVAEYVKHGNGAKFIAFGASVAHCQEMQRQFLAAGVQCGLYTYRTGDAERAEMAREFRKPDSYIRGLISVAALAKGFDVSDVEVVVLARPLRSSLAEHIQMLGRGLRSHPGKKICTVLDHAGNVVRFWDAMHDFFENGATELDDGARKEKPKPEKTEAKPRKCPKCFHVHKAAPYCPACGFEYPSRSNIVQEVGELREVGTAGAKREDKQAVYSQLLQIAHLRGHSPGWVAHKYKDRFGVWPRGMQDVPMTPTPEILNWVRSRNIAYAKARKR